MGLLLPIYMYFFEILTVGFFYSYFIQGDFWRCWQGVFVGGCWGLFG